MPLGSVYLSCWTWSNKLETSDFLELAAFSFNPLSPFPRVRQVPIVIPVNMVVPRSESAVTCNRRDKKASRKGTSWFLLSFSLWMSTCSKVYVAKSFPWKQILVVFFITALQFVKCWMTRVYAHIEVYESLISLTGQYFLFKIYLFGVHIEVHAQLIRIIN